MMLPEQREDYANRLIRLGLAVQIVGTELQSDAMPDDQLMKTLAELLDKIDKVSAQVTKANRNGA